MTIYWFSIYKPIVGKFGDYQYPRLSYPVIISYPYPLSKWSVIILRSYPYDHTFSILSIWIIHLPWAPWSRAPGTSPEAQVQTGGFLVTGLVEGNILTGFPMVFARKIGFSYSFSLKPIHWVVAHWKIEHDTIGVCFFFSPNLHVVYYFAYFLLFLLIIVMIFGGGFRFRFCFPRIFGMMIPDDEHSFLLGWNHQPFFLIVLFEMMNKSCSSVYVYITRHWSCYGSRSGYWDVGVSLPAMVKLHRLCAHKLSSGIVINPLSFWLRLQYV